jgi:hypothetical protein
VITKILQVDSDFDRVAIYTLGDLKQAEDGNMDGRFGPGGGRQRRQFPGAGRVKRGGIGGSALGPAARQKLVQANQQLLAGEFAQAALLFTGVMALTQQRGMPFRSANLGARAAMAYYQANDPAHGLEYAAKAVDITLQSGNVALAVRIARQLMAQLQSQGHADQVENLREKLDAMLRPFGVSLTGAPASGPSRSAHLPAQCPSCLGPVRADEVDWINESTVECAYCGTPIHTE